MKSILATNPQSTTQPAVFRLGEEAPYVQRIQTDLRCIARRAYELFEARGFVHGHDREDWFRAESELLTPIPAKIVDRDGEFRVRAEVPGLQPKTWKCGLSQGA